jgi:chromosome segregation ATPase
MTTSAEDVITGCGNHGCILKPLPKGAMGTNAICQCATRKPREMAIVMGNLRALIASQAAEIAALKAELSRHQESEFHPDWSMLKATRESLAEHQVIIRSTSDERDRALRERNEARLEVTSQAAEIAALKTSRASIDEMRAEISRLRDTVAGLMATLEEARRILD